VAPVVDAGPDVEIEPGASVLFGGSFTDPGDDTHEIVWDFGDGAKETGTLTPSHVFTSPGVYEVILTVTDSHGASGSDRLQVRAQCRAAWIETFDTYEPGVDPEGWVDYEVSGHRLRSGSKVQGFRTASSGGDVVYRSVKSRRATEYRTSDSLLWRDYEWSGSFLLSHRDRSSLGLLVLSDLASGSFYQVRLKQDESGEDDGDDHEEDDEEDDEEEKADGDEPKPYGIRVLRGLSGHLEGKTRSSLAPAAAGWYRFRIRVENLSEETRLSARFWPLGGAEPRDWQIDAWDRREPLRNGAIGVLVGRGKVSFDDLGVEALSESSGISGDREGDGVCDGEDNCPAMANPNQSDRDADGTGDACDSCTAAFARVETCLDEGYDPATGLSDGIIEREGDVRHDSEGGTCGSRGSYRLGRGSALAFETPELPQPGSYRLQFALDAGDVDGLTLEIDGLSHAVTLQEGPAKGPWRWSDWLTLELSEGVHVVRVRSERTKSVGIEEVRLEQSCAH
jgi:hypothetical protein